MKWSGLLVLAWGCSDSIWLNQAYQPQQKDTLLQMRNQIQRSECHPKSGRPEPDMQIGKYKTPFELPFLSNLSLCECHKRICVLIWGHLFHNFLRLKRKGVTPPSRSERVARDLHSRMGMPVPPMPSHSSGTKSRRRRNSSNSSQEHIGNLMSSPNLHTRMNKVRQLKKEYSSRDLFQSFLVLAKLIHPSWTLSCNVYKCRNPCRTCYGETIYDYTVTVSAWFNIFCVLLIQIFLFPFFGLRFFLLFFICIIFENQQNNGVGAANVTGQLMYRSVVGYLGTIEMPEDSSSQSSPSSGVSGGGLSASGSHSNSNNSAAARLAAIR